MTLIPRRINRSVLSVCLVVWSSLSRNPRRLCRSASPATCPSVNRDLLDSIAYRRFHLRTRKRLGEISRSGPRGHSLFGHSSPGTSRGTPLAAYISPESATAHCSKVPRTARAARSRRCLIQRTVRPSCPRPASSKVRYFFVACYWKANFWSSKTVPCRPARSRNRPIITAVIGSLMRCGKACRSWRATKWSRYVSRSII